MRGRLFQRTRRVRRAKPFVAAVIVRRGVIDAGTLRVGAVEETSGDLLRLLFGDLDLIHRRRDAVVGRRRGDGGGIGRSGWDRTGGEAGGSSSRRRRKRRSGLLFVFALVGVLRFVGHG